MSESVKSFSFRAFICRPALCQDWKVNAILMPLKNTQNPNFKKLKTQCENPEIPRNLALFFSGFSQFCIELFVKATRNGTTF